MKMLMKMEKKIMTLTTHHDAQYAPHAMSYASPCFLAYAPYYALCPMPPCLSPPMPVFPALLLSHPLCSQSGMIAFHVTCGCHAPNRFGTVNMEDNINIE